MIDYAEWQTDRDVRRRAIDEALAGSRWQRARDLIGEQGDADDQLRRWLDRAIVAAAQAALRG